MTIEIGKHYLYTQYSTYKLVKVTDICDTCGIYSIQFQEIDNNNILLPFEQYGIPTYFMSVPDSINFIDNEITKLQKLLVQLSNVL